MRIDKKLFGFFFAFACIVTLFSCKPREVKIPEGILTKQKLIPVLVDIHLAQTVVGLNQLNDSTGFGLNEYLTAILKLHHVTKQSYENSLTFYTSHPEMLNEIYQEVINELSKKQSEVSAK